MQGLTIGGTDYSAQSLNDIKKDVIKWKEFLEDLKSFLKTEINILKNDSFWGNNVPLNFRIYVGSLPKVISTFISDFNLILEDLNNELITKRTVNLLNRIGEEANKEYDLASHTYNVDSPWEEYGNPSFEKVEKLYAECSDVFGTLIDASNAATRLEDYMETGKDKSIVIDNSVHIGDNNEISDSVIGTSQKDIKISKKNESKPKERIFGNFFWKLIVPIAVTVIAAIILAWLGIKGE